jgi:hypothetical protein
MKKKLLLIGTLLIGFGVGYWSCSTHLFVEDITEKTKSLPPPLKDSILTSLEMEVEQEDFDDFFYQFMIDPDFQLSRIKFPLRSVSFKDGYPSNKRDTTYITKDQWHHDFYYLDQTSIPKIYDNYKMQLQDTDERVFVWSGVENGINVQSFFKRIDGYWRFIKRVDVST